MFGFLFLRVPKLPYTSQEVKKSILFHAIIREYEKATTSTCPSHLFIKMLKIIIIETWAQGVSKESLLNVYRLVCFALLLHYLKKNHHKIIGISVCYVFLQITTCVYIGMNC